MTEKFFEKCGVTRETPIAASGGTYTQSQMNDTSDIDVNVEWIRPEDMIVAIDQLQEMVHYLLRRDAGLVPHQGDRVGCDD